MGLDSDVEPPWQHHLQQPLQLLFNCFDYNGDKELTNTERWNLIRKLGVGAFRWVDEDQSGGMSYMEFVKAFFALPEEQTKQTITICRLMQTLSEGRSISDANATKLFHFLSVDGKTVPLASVKGFASHALKQCGGLSEQGLSHNELRKILTEEGDVQEPSPMSETELLARGLKRLFVSLTGDLNSLLGPQDRALLCRKLELKYLHWSDEDGDGFMNCSEFVKMLEGMDKEETAGIMTLAMDLAAADEFEPLPGPPGDLRTRLGSFSLGSNSFRKSSMEHEPSEAGFSRLFKWLARRFEPSVATSDVASLWDMLGLHPRSCPTGALDTARFQTILKSMSSEGSQEVLAAAKVLGAPSNVDPNRAADRVGLQKLFTIMSHGAPCLDAQSFVSEAERVGLPLASSLPHGEKWCYEEFVRALCPNLKAKPCLDPRILDEDLDGCVEISSQFSEAAECQPLCYRKGHVLGAGSFGTVFQGFDMTHGKLVAVKSTPIARASKATITRIKAEVECLKRLSHPCIVSYLGVDVKPDTVDVVLEFVAGGSTANLLKRYGAFEESVVSAYISQMLQGLSYLHSQGVVHQDIKPGNILITDQGQVKLGDFGSCVKLNHNNHNPRSNWEGTIAYAAPEAVRHEQCTTSWDVWSVGCTVIHMRANRLPWHERNFDNQLAAMVHIGQATEPPDIPNELSLEGGDFVSRCCQIDPHQRPTVDQLQVHPMMSQQHRARCCSDTLAESLGLSSSGSLSQVSSELRFSPSAREIPNHGSFDTLTSVTHSTFTTTRSDGISLLESTSNPIAYHSIPQWDQPARKQVTHHWKAIQQRVKVVRLLSKQIDKSVDRVMNDCRRGPDGRPLQTGA